MRRLALGQPPHRFFKEEDRWLWIFSALKEIERASFENDIGEIADGFTVVNFTDTRTLDASTATVADVANVLCTLLNDMKNRGTKRGT